MRTTIHFETLKQEVKEKIRSDEKPNEINWSSIKKVNSEENRSLIFEVIGTDIILKKFLDKGKRDEDINALLDLDGINYFPKLYAYKEREYLFMEKAQGLSLPEFIESGATYTELNEIKMLLLDAFSKMLDRKRKDWDFKLEHIFWCKKNKKLTWIDFSICDEHSNFSKDIEFKDFEKNFMRKLSHWDKKLSLNSSDHSSM